MEGSTSARDTASTPAATQDVPRSVLEAFHRTVERLGDRVAIRTKGDAFTITWDELRRRVDDVAGGLAGLGLERGQNAAIMLANRPEFHIVDLAISTVGATPFSIYATSSPEQIRYVVADAEARILITEQQFLDQVLRAREELPQLEHVIVVDGEGRDGVTQLADVEGANPDFDAEASAARLGPDDLLTLIYTSGTTGPPKGVQLTHGNLIQLAVGVQDMIEFPEGSQVISWLPNAHIAERGAHHYVPVIRGVTITTCEDPRQVMSYLPEVRPTWFFAVPRIWEKLKSGLEAMLAQQEGEEKERMQAALTAAREKLRLDQAGEQVPAELAEQVRQADEQIFSGLRTMLGLDQCKIVHVGAAPTPREVLEFFNAIGIHLAELWGLSETSGVATANPPGAIKIGTVGPPVPGVEIKLADDGEVLVRGPGNMVGYRNQPEKTAETFDEEAWLRTGDIGTIDDDGYLTIVDRKKELIISAAGKNMSPSNIEGTIKSSSALIGQIAVIGDARPYNTALIVLDPDTTPVWAKEHGRDGASLEVLAGDEDLRAAIQSGVDRGNAQLSRVEQIKKFTVLPDEWLPGGEELTPTMKLKRKPIAEKYAGEIEAMYGG
jgi:long-chain acyl-CoA synthetase